MSINENEKAILLLAAREAIHSSLDNEVVLSEIDDEFYPELTRRNSRRICNFTKQGQLTGMCWLSFFK